MKAHLSQRSRPGPRLCSDAGGRGPELGPEQEPGVPSWLQTGETAAPRSWTCPNTGWTPPDWAARDAARIQSRPESAAVTGTASEKEKIVGHDVEARHLRNEWLIGKNTAGTFCETQTRLKR